jgi:RNA polymerase sigma-70 factor (ECF subfamily)
VDAPSQGAGTEASNTTLSPHVRRQLEAAYRTEAKRLQRYLRRKAGDDAASDLVQEVFVRTAASRQLTDLLHPGAYLFKVARNLLIERARARQRHDTVFMPFDEEHDAACPAEQLEAMEASELMQRYERAVACMPEKTRRAF